MSLDGVEPSSCSYKERALSIELQARLSMRPEGFEPTLCELKARCAAVTPRPRIRTWLRLRRCSRGMKNLPSKKSPETELNRRSRLIRTRCFRYTTRRSDRTSNFPSGWSESNRLSRVPKTRGRPVPLNPLKKTIDPCGIRTQPSQCERLATSPEVERAMSLRAQSPCPGSTRSFC